VCLPAEADQYPEAKKKENKQTKLYYIISLLFFRFFTFSVSSLSLPAGSSPLPPAPHLPLQVRPDANRRICVIFIYSNK